MAAKLHFRLSYGPAEEHFGGSISNRIAKKRNFDLERKRRIYEKIFISCHGSFAARDLER